MRFFCPTKINLFLRINGKRPDGYHNIQSVFCRLDFGDWLTVRRADRPTNRLVTLSVSTPIDGDPNDNLILKASNALLNYAQKHKVGAPFALRIHLQKNAPIGAGLGGGSSNAATTLLALNRLWQTRLDRRALLDLGKSLGADVPFFVGEYRCAVASGIGDTLAPIDLPARRYFVVCPPKKNATAAFFAHPNLQKNHAFIDKKTLIDDVDRYAYALLPPYCNAFEAIAKADLRIEQAFDFLRPIAQTLGSTPRLTGTGSAVFLPLPPDIDAKTVQTWQSACPFFCFVAKNY